MRLAPITCALLLLAPLALAGDRVPGERWMRYADPADAGFDAAALEAARETWESLPSSAFLVVADGAVVAAWGDVERRFMCHSVRKSFLSALYGVAWDRGDLELNKTLEQLGIDDAPDPLLPIEKQARILDLLKARSGVYHPAAYAGRTDSAPRGSVPPGQAFGYNNWDFNTLATIFIAETGEDVFESFDAHFGRPLGMQDWRVRDGYYHHEPDKSIHPAYPFRLSARDAARFGLLFARDGTWGDERILSKHWVERSTALYSIDNDVMGYGFMWWVLRQPPFVDHGMVAALGVGNQMIASLPESDLVIVNRADTYRGESTPTRALLDLVRQVLAARTGEPTDAPELVPLEDAARRFRAPVDREDVAELLGTWPHPPAGLGREGRPVTTLTLALEDDALLMHVPVRGSFELFPQPDGSFECEDSGERIFVVRDEAGAVAGLADAGLLVGAALLDVAAGALDRAESRLDGLVGGPPLEATVCRAAVRLARGDADGAVGSLRPLVSADSGGALEMTVNRLGYGLLQADAKELARELFEVNVRLHPHAPNVWDSLGEALAELGRFEESLEAYDTALALDPGNENASVRSLAIRAMVAREVGAGVTGDRPADNAAPDEEPVPGRNDG